MNSYCTLFDSAYLTRGLALHRSMVNTGEDFHLYVFCFDDKSRALLEKLNLASTTLLNHSDFENAALLAVKPTRTRAEYCWTCTPQIIRYALERFKLNEITYLDADLYFFKKPGLLLDEWRAANASILLTEHRYSPEYAHAAISGRYCVQFMTFKADERSRRALLWWQERCLEWCFNRVEDGKFGDQKYLDDWTARFEGVHVLKHLGGGVAPWNVQQYEVNAGPCVDGIPVVFYHFHKLRWLADERFDLSEYRLSQEATDLLYRPYLAELKQSLATVRKIEPSFESGIEKPELSPRSLLRGLKRKLTGTYRIVSS